MNILITNDDGIFASGIILLTKALNGLGNLYVVAPETPQSGKGVSMTVRGELVVKEHNDYFGATKAYSVYGTPADCVRISQTLFKNVSFDFLISGVNQGANLGSDVYHSGTLGAALEALMIELPSLAISANYTDDSLAKQYVRPLVETILKHALLSTEYALNINFPKEMDIYKIAFTSQAITKDEAHFEEIKNHTFINKFNRKTDVLETTDVYAYYHQMISITPIRFDKTDYDALHYLKRFTQDLNGLDKK